MDPVPPYDPIPDQLKLARKIRHDLQNLLFLLQSTEALASPEAQKLTRDVVHVEDLIVLLEAQRKV